MSTCCFVWGVSHDMCAYTGSIIGCRLGGYSQIWSLTLKTKLHIKGVL